jgi:tRNA1(Val) A37 N6-methylase TrmN6
MKLKADERIEELTTELKIIQKKHGHKFGQESLLLAKFISTHAPKGSVVELGSGCGIIPFLLSKEERFNKIYGIEIQSHLVEMAQRSVELNNLSARVKFFEGELKEVKKFLGKLLVEVVLSNPPHYPLQGKQLPQRNSELIARHEVRCNIREVIQGASSILKSRGYFYLIHIPERLLEIASLLPLFSLSPTKLCFAYSKERHPARFFLLEARKDVKSPLQVLPPIQIN